MKNVILYGTCGCHLCEEALQVITNAIYGYSVSVTQVDIADDDRLLERYGLLIPVLSDHGRELHWPFDTRAVESFLSHKN